MLAFTVGHSTRSADELLELLREPGVTALADVRAFPSSRRHPQFNQAVMRDWLADAGIEYRHFPGLGGRRQPQPDSVNLGWREPAFQGYADHMATPEFQRSLAELEALARSRPTAIMCAEALWWRCHRRLIADALLVRDWQVVHLGVDPAHAIHQLPAWAVVGADGTLTYPPLQTTLLPDDLA